MKTENSPKTKKKTSLSKQDALFVALLGIILVFVLDYIAAKKHYDSLGLAPKVRVVKGLAPPIVIDKVQAPQKGSQKKRQESAANFFLGFYMVNDKTRPEFCLNHGVDISEFTAAFRKAHKSEYDIAVKILSAKPSGIMEFHQMIKPKAMRLIEKDMLDIAKTSKVSVADACRLFSNDAESIAANMHFSVKSPDVHRVLVSGQ